MWAKNLYIKYSINEVMKPCMINFVPYMLSHISPAVSAPIVNVIRIHRNLCLEVNSLVRVPVKMNPISNASAI